jgi:hypothetical protein
LVTAALLFLAFTVSSCASDLLPPAGYANAFAAAEAQAQANAETNPNYDGWAIEGEYARGLILSRCPPGDHSGVASWVVQVGADGLAQEVLASPYDTFTVCVAEALRGLSFPKPGTAPYWWSTGIITVR